jgi:hypothetical protein
VNERNDFAEQDVVRRLIWGALLAVIGALASIVASRASEAIYQRVFNEEPPQ